VVASVTAGGGAVSGTTSAATDGSGHAAFSNLALVGPQGAQTLRFGVATPGVEVTSLVQLTAGTPASMEGGAPLAYEGTVNSPVSPGPTVLVKDAAGNPVPGVAVSFTPNRNSSVSPETATTNAQGIAQVSWTLGSVANVGYSLTARIEGTTIAAVRFSAMARPGNAGRLRVAVQPSSPTASGTAFATQPVIQLEDQNGNPTPQAGVRVTASVSSGPNGSLENASATTDASGQAAFSGLTVMGLVGNYTLSFSAPSLVGVTSAPFAITAGAPAKLAVTTAPSALARSRFAIVIQPVLEVQDASGNPIRQAGTQVDASVTAPNTSISGQSVVTDENGRAAFTALTLQGIPGPKDVTFSSPTAPGLQSAKAKVTLVSVENVTVVASHPTSAVVGSTVPGVVSTWTLKDGSLRPVADADFNIRLPSGGRVDAPPFSDEFGTVQVSNWTLGTAAGYQIMEFILPSGRTFRDSILAQPDVAADLLQVAGGDAQTGPVNSTLPNPLVVQVVDRFGNGVPDVPVQWATCDGQAGPLVNTDASGYSSVIQPTGSQPTTGCTQATTTQVAGDRIEFTYTVTAGSQTEQPQGVSAAQSRRGGPPPVAAPRGSEPRR